MFIPRIPKPVNEEELFLCFVAQVWFGAMPQPLENYKGSRVGVSDPWSPGELDEINVHFFWRRVYKLSLPDICACISIHSL